MLTARANVHRSKLPNAGAIVTVHTERSPLPRSVRFRRFIVESFNLCDSADHRYSLGIHLVNLQALDDGERVTVAGHYCEEEA